MTLSTDFLLIQFPTFINYILLLIQGCIFFPKIGFFIKYYSKVLSFFINNDDRYFIKKGVVFYKSARFHKVVKFKSAKRVALTVLHQLNVKLLAILK